MITVSEGGSYLVTGGIGLSADSIKWAEGSSKEHYMFFIVVVLQTTNLSAMVCIG